MASFYFYLVVGIALIALELATTTFYLLVIGIAAVIAAIVAFFTQGWIFPTISAGILSVIACFIVSGRRSKSNNNGVMLITHLGQSVEVTEVRKDNLRVLYSGSHWNARCKNITDVKVGDKLVITKFSNTELEVTR